MSLTGPETPTNPTPPETTERLSSPFLLRLKKMEGESWGEKKPASISPRPSSPKGASKLRASSGQG